MHQSGLFRECFADTTTLLVRLPTNGAKAASPVYLHTYPQGPLDSAFSIDLKDNQGVRFER
jgi:hypothetical protein